MLIKSQMQHIEWMFNEASDEQMQEIANMFNDARRGKAYNAARSFKVGQRVAWYGRKGSMSGEVIKVMKKNIRVKTEADGIWNVTASLLKAA